MDLDDNRSELPEAMDNLPSNNQDVQHTLDWLNENDYTKTLEPGTIRYTHSRAGRVLEQSATTWGNLQASRHKLHPDVPYFPFPNKAQWELAHWLSTCKTSQSKIDELLGLENVSTYHAAHFLPINLFHRSLLKLRAFGVRASCMG